MKRLPFWKNIQWTKGSYQMCLVFWQYLTIFSFQFIKPVFLLFYPQILYLLYVRGAVHTQVTTQKVHLTLWVDGLVWKGVLWCYALTICILFPDTESCWSAVKTTTLRVSFHFQHSSIVSLISLRWRLLRKA